MIKIDKILCPVDFSDFSAKAFDYAYSFARRYQAALYLQHVIRPLTEYAYHVLPAWAQQYYDESRAEAGEALRKLVARLASSGSRPEFVIQVGFPADAILEFAGKQAVDLIVMGTQGRRGADRWMLGSVTESVIRKAKCPVLAVRRPDHDFVAPAAPEDPVQLRKILLATDFSDHGQRAFAYAISLAMEYQAELILLHVLEDLPQDEELATASARLIRDLEAPVPADARNWCRIKSVVRVGKPYQEIIQLAVEEQTDLLILGVRGRGAADLKVFGSTTHRVIQLGPCPVLAVHLEAGGERAG
jgi:nucleotide-binding universal stress UspA family protein